MTPAGDDHRTRDWAACAALALLVVAVFGRIVGHEFVALDDHVYLTENAHVQQGLSVEGVRWAFTTGTASNWHPLTWLSHMLDWQLFGAWAGGHHLVNAALHAVNVGLLWVVLRNLLAWSTRGESLPAERLSVATDKKRPVRSPRSVDNAAATTLARPDAGLDFWIACAAAALYAVHPLRVESVAWASERKDVLCGVFWWLALLVYLRGADCGPRRPARRSRLAVAALLGIGLLAKPMLVTLPAVLVLLDGWPLRRCNAGAGPRGAQRTWIEWGKRALEKWPLWLLVAASSVVTYQVQRAGGAVLEADRYPLGAKLAVVLHAYAKYLEQTIWPRGLCAFYPIPVREVGGQGLSYPPAIVSGLLLVAVSALCFWQRRKRPYLLVGWLWYLVTLAPVIGLVKVGDQYHADRYTYVPQFGLLLWLTFGARELLQRRPGWTRPLATAATATTVALAAICFQQAGTWRNTETLARHALAVTRENHMAHYLLGTALARDNDKTQAMEQFQLALRYNPTDFVARFDLATFQLERGEYDLAEENLQQIVADRPHFPQAHVGLAAVYAKRREHAHVLAELDAALKLDRRHAAAHLGRGDVLMALGRPAEAADAYAEAAALGAKEIELTVKHAEALVRGNRAAQAEPLLQTYTKQAGDATPELRGRASYLLGLAQQALGRSREAAATWGAALEGTAWRVETANDLAWLLATTDDEPLRDGGRAVAIAQAMCAKIQPTPPALLDTLAAAQAAVGDFQGALATVKRALADPAATSDASLTEQLRQRAAQYERSEPYREQAP